jgi:hypothetical protein
MCSPALLQLTNDLGGAKVVIVEVDAAVALSVAV